METMPFTRGDGILTNTKYFYMPTANWSPGGNLYFTAKITIDDSTTDAEAMIKGNWTDADVTDVTRNGVAYKKYTCGFPSVATFSVPSDGAAYMDLLGDFQWIPSGGQPITFPPIGDKIPVRLWFDVTRRITP